MRSPPRITTKGIRKHVSTPRKRTRDVAAAGKTTSITTPKQPTLPRTPPNQPTLPRTPPNQPTLPPTPPATPTLGCTSATGALISSSILRDGDKAIADCVESRNMTITAILLKSQQWAQHLRSLGKRCAATKYEATVSKMSVEYLSDHNRLCEALSVQYKQFAAAAYQNRETISEAVISRVSATYIAENKCRCEELSDKYQQLATAAYFNRLTQDDGNTELGQKPRQSWLDIVLIKD